MTDTARSLTGSRRVGKWNARAGGLAELLAVADCLLIGKQAINLPIEPQLRIATTIPVGLGCRVFLIR